MTTEQIKERISILNEQHDNISRQLRDQLYKIKNEIKELQESLSSFYIGVIKEDCDFSIHTDVYVIGDTTYDQAESFMECRMEGRKNCASHGYLEYDVFDIPKEMECKLKKLDIIEDILDSLDTLQGYISSKEKYEKFFDMVSDDVYDLKEELHKELQDKTKVYIANSFSIHTF